MDAVQIVTPETLFPPRKRAFRSKTKTGCMTCRIRRIKCDEVRPSCSQCTRGRRACDGYGHDKKNDSVGSPDSQLGVTLPTRLFETDIEVGHFEFFLNMTAPRLSGPFKSEFWDQSVLQATHHERAIKHAIIAISALHQGFVKGQNGTKNPCWHDDAYAVKHYLKAIQYLVVPVGKSEEGQLTDVTLMTCILFVCFEVLRGFHGAALAHIDGGIKLFTQLQKSFASNTKMDTKRYASVAVLTSIMARLDKQASSITHDRPRNLLSTPRSPCEQIVPEPEVVCFLAKPFTHVEDARSALDKIENAAVRASSSIIDPTLIIDYASSAQIQSGMTIRRGYSRLRLQQWLTRLDDFIRDNRRTLTTDDYKAIEVLMVTWVVMDINFRIDFLAVTKNEMLWDKFLPDFAAIVKHAQRFVRCEKEQGCYAPVFTLEMEIILPLYFVAAKCRDGQLRREAIRILSARERQEGVWNAALTSRLCHRLVQMEEEEVVKTAGLPVKMEEVKGEWRVQGVEVKWDLERRRVNLVYRSMDIANGGHGVVEVNGNVPMS